jgi:hypothetical protein
VAVDDNTSIGATVAVAGAYESAHTYGYGYGYGTGREADDGDYGSVAGNENEHRDKKGASAGVALSDEQLLGLFGTV